MARRTGGDWVPQTSWSNVGTADFEREMEGALGPVGAYDVVGWPGAALEAPLRAGDVLIRANPRDPSRPLLARLTGPELRHAEVIEDAEAEQEGDGWYAEAVQITRPGTAVRPAHRLVLNPRGAVGPTQIVLRPVGAVRPIAIAPMVTHPPAPPASSAPTPVDEPIPIEEPLLAGPEEPAWPEPSNATGPLEEDEPTTPVLSLDKLKIGGLPEIALELGSSGQFEGFLREPPSSYNGTVRLSGCVRIEEAGVRRGYDYERDRGRWPLGKAWADVAVGGPISSSGAESSPVKRDGTFITSTWISYQPYLVRRLAIQVSVESDKGKRLGARAVAELVDLPGFLAIVDPKEKGRSSSQSNLEFLASVRKVYHGGPDDPAFEELFNLVLYRNRNVKPLFAPDTPEWKRLRLYKILYDNGEWLETGHVLCGIEGSPGQLPNKDQNAPLPLRPQLIVTWSGDLGSALQRYIQHYWLATDKTGTPIDKDDPLDLDYFLRKEASRSDLIGDVDGINVASAYDSSRSLADNLNAYYGKRSRRRFAEFIANSKNERGAAELPLAPGGPPFRLSQQARQAIGLHARNYLVPFWVLGKLYDGPEPAKRKVVDDMMRADSAQMKRVVDYFVRFLEDGLVLEQRQGLVP